MRHPRPDSGGDAFFPRGAPCVQFSGTEEARVSTLDIILQQLANGLILGSFYSLVALGYTMVYGIIKL